MAKIGPSFDKHTQGGLLRSVPAGHAQKESVQQDNSKPPWELVDPHHMPPMMFQLRFDDGSMNSFAYSDLREIYCRDPGYIMLSVQSIDKCRIQIEGRHLRVLADCLSLGKVRWVQQADPRCDPKPESSPEVLAITIEIIPD